MAWIFLSRKIRKQKRFIHCLKLVGIVMMTTMTRKTTQKPDNNIHAAQTMGVDKKKKQELSKSWRRKDLKVFWKEQFNISKL